MTEQIAEEFGHEQSRNTRKRGDICPSLVLAARVVCDKGDVVHEPDMLQVRECCTTELHRHCMLPFTGTEVTMGRLAVSSYRAAVRPGRAGEP